MARLKAKPDRGALWVSVRTRDAVIALKRGRETVDDVVRRLLGVRP